MFLPIVERGVQTFNMDDSKQLAEYEDLIKDPLVTILEKRYQKKRQEEWLGEEGTVEEELHLIVEFERKSL